MLKSVVYDAKTMAVINEVVQAGLAYGRQLEEAKAASKTYTAKTLKTRKKLVRLETKFLQTAEKLYHVATCR